MQHVELARAKVNVALHVLGRRDDGYHLLDSVVAFAGVADRLTLRPAGQTSLTVVGPFAEGLPVDEGNLVLRARALLSRHVEVPDVAVVLEKNLPVAAGLGGGSADAAAMMRGLLALSGKVVADDVLAVLALELGADVPVCLRQRASRMQGIGEQVTLLDRAPSPAMVLVNPRVPCSTPQVFGAMGIARGAAYRAGLDLAQPDAWRNDMTSAACQVQPAIAEVLARLAEVPELSVVRMSGSGATCFGLAADLGSAKAAAARVQALHPEWWVSAGDLQ